MSALNVDMAQQQKALYLCHICKLCTTLYAVACSIVACDRHNNVTVISKMVYVSRNIIHYFTKIQAPEAKKNKTSLCGS